MAAKAISSGWRLTKEQIASCESENATIVLHVEQMHDGGFKTPYFAIRGAISGINRSYVTRLILTCEDWTRAETTILFSRKGRVFEMVELSAPIIEAQLVLNGFEPLATDFALEISPLSRSGFRARQLHRISRVLRGPQRAHLRAVGTTWRQIANLDSLYAIASRFRANVFTYSYGEWFEEFYSLTTADIKRIAKISQRWERQPSFSVYIDVRGFDRADVRATVDSLQSQLYARLEIIIIEDDHVGSGSPLASQTSFTDSEYQWNFLVPAGSIFEPFALFWFAHEVLRSPESCLIYCDHDHKALGGGVAAPMFKPDFSLELLRSENYIGSAYCWRNSALPLSSTNCKHSSSYARLLTLAGQYDSAKVVHIPACLIHFPERILGDEERASDDKSLVKHFEDMRVEARVDRTVSARRRVVYMLPRERPLISVIVPTRNGFRHLMPCIQSLLEKTSYHPLEILVVDNQSDDIETIDYFNYLRTLDKIKIISFDEPFNYSRMNNFAVSRAQGEWICLLNNDTEVISSDWLEDMAGYLAQPGVGVVGAKLLYSDGTVQHAGDAVGPGGCADHFHSGIGRNDPGYAGRALLAQDLSAVTAACLLTKASLFNQLGGLDEINLPVAFNDVDYCLRVREVGMRVVWTPHALLYHHESISRGKDVTPAQMKRAASELTFMKVRWKDVMQHDPFYNPNLSYLRPDFSLSSSPRVIRPWVQASA